MSSNIVQLRPRPIRKRIGSFAVGELAGDRIIVRVDREYCSGAQCVVELSVDAAATLANGLLGLVEAAKAEGSEKR